MYGHVLLKSITISFDILKVMGLKVKVTDGCSGGGRWFTVKTPNSLYFHHLVTRHIRSSSIQYLTSRTVRSYCDVHDSLATSGKATD